MNKQFISYLFVTSLTIFAMLFGAGNLMLPLRLGLEAGQATFIGFLGFALTAVIVPVIGLLAIVAFNGDYQAFFGRLGKTAGFFAILFCMFVIGPLVVMPRIVTLSYEMLRPFLPDMSVLTFAIIFLSLVFAATYRPGKLLGIIGKFLSPLKVSSIIAIVAIGMATGGVLAPATESLSTIFFKGLESGYMTLDLLGSIFFGSIIVTLLTQAGTQGARVSVRDAVKISGYSSVLAALLLGGVYLGMSYLGAYFGAGLEALNEGEIFSTISFRILGHYGAALIGFTVFLACFTTAVSLSAVVGQYTQKVLFMNKISYPTALVVVLTVCALISRHGLGAILHFSLPFIVIAYPIFITIAVCNLLYALCGFRYIKAPVAFVALLVIGNFIAQRAFETAEVQICAVAQLGQE